MRKLVTWIVGRKLVTWIVGRKLATWIVGRKLVTWIMWIVEVVVAGNMDHVEIL